MILPQPPCTNIGFEQAIHTHNRIAGFRQNKPSIMFLQNVFAIGYMRDWGAGDVFGRNNSSA